MSGVQHNVVVPSAAVGDLRDANKLQVEHIRDVSLGQGGHDLARYAVACGADVVTDAFQNFTISVGGPADQTTSGTQRSCSALAGRPSCVSCPGIQVL